MARRRRHRSTLAPRDCRRTRLRRGSSAGRSSSRIRHKSMPPLPPPEKMTPPENCAQDFSQGGMPAKERFLAHRPEKVLDCFTGFTLPNDVGTISTVIASDSEAIQPCRGKILDRFVVSLLAMTVAWQHCTQLPAFPGCCATRQCCAADPGPSFSLTRYRIRRP